MTLKVFTAAILSAGVFALAAPAQAATGPEEGHDASLADKIRCTRDIVKEFSGGPSFEIPHTILKEAKAIVIISNAIKAGFLFAGEHGRGVALVRSDSGEWSAPAFFRMTGISVGFQAGGEVDDVILVLRSQRALEGLLDHPFTIGVDFDATAGPVGREVEAATNVRQAEMYCYARNHGFFAGVSLNGLIIHEDNEASARYYGEPLSARQIMLENKAYPTKPASELADALRAASGQGS